MQSIIIEHQNIAILKYSLSKKIKKNFLTLYSQIYFY